MASGGFPHVSAKIPGSGRLPSPGRMPTFGDFGSPSSFQLRDAQGKFLKGGFGFVWTGLDGVFGMPSKLADNLTEELKANMERIREMVEEDAKANAPWEDRSHDARNGLKAALVINDREGTYTIFLGHSVAYGVFLEYANGGNFAIIEPTLRKYSSALLAPISGGEFAVG